MMKKNLSFISLSACIILSACDPAEQDAQTVKSSTEKQPVDYVNPFIGASTLAGKDQTEFFPGKTFPGAASPYGLAQFSPNTVTGGDNASGYSDENTSIEGFSVMHLSGTGWYGEFGNFLVMPTTGAMKTIAGRIGKEAEGWRSDYKKENENATAGYYSVLLDKYNVRAEMTVAPHSGIMRFTFPENKQSRIQIDLARRIAGTSVLQSVKVLNDSTIQGWMKCTPKGGGFGNGDANNPYTVYFYAKFSKPLKDFGVWSADIPDSWIRKRDEVVSDKYVQQVAK
ncbi:MAG: glycoside hydrolase family 92 protein, partial [Sphingobacteriaceae bacterium]